MDESTQLQGDPMCVVRCVGQQCDSAGFDRGIKEEPPVTDDESLGDVGDEFECRGDVQMVSGGGRGLHMEGY